MAFSLESESNNKMYFLYEEVSGEKMVDSEQLFTLDSLLVLVALSLIVFYQLCTNLL